MKLTKGQAESNPERWLDPVQKADCQSGTYWKGRMGGQGKQRIAAMWGADTHRHRSSTCSAVSAGTFCRTEGDIVVNWLSMICLRVKKGKPEMAIVGCTVQSPTLEGLRRTKKLTRFGD